MANTTPIKAIRAKCVQCKGLKNSITCTDEGCPLHPYREGRNPNIKREMTPEQRQAAAERLRKARENRG